MRDLDDYLDAFDARPRSVRVGRERLTKGQLGALPSAVLSVRAPIVARPGIFSLALEPAESPGQRAFIDAQMWGLDNEYASAANFVSMKSCVRYTKVDPATYVAYAAGIPIDASGGAPVSESWFSRNVQEHGCRGGSFNQPVAPTCLWGFWKLNRCDTDTATKYVFQFPRYLWAQRRMREMLARKPVQGVTSAQEAADWAWEACQYVSVLLWSTNIRFDNPNGKGGTYPGGTGLRFDMPPPPPYDGPPTANPPRAIPLSSDTPANRLFGATPTWTTITPFILNDGNFGSVNAPELSVLPRTKQDFSPVGGPADIMALGRPYFALASAGGPVPFTATLAPSPMQVPFGVTAEQAREVMNAAIALGGQLRVVNGTPTWLPRWTIAKAWNDWWFRATWNWDTLWKPVADGHYLQRGGDHGQWSPKVTFVAPGAKVTIDSLAAMLEHYSRRELFFTDWLQQAVLTYAEETSGEEYSGGPAGDFREARLALMNSVAEAHRRQNDLQNAAGIPAYATGTARDVLMVSQMVQSLILMIASYIPVVGQVVTAAFSTMQQVLNNLLRHGWAAVGNTPCPALPFMRVMMPDRPCDLTAESITSSLLGVDSNATWPVSVAGQSLTFSVDGTTFTARFDATSTTAEAVARRINSAAADAGLGPVAAVHSGGQIHVEGIDPSYGKVRVTGGDAVALGFPLSVPGAPPPRSVPSRTPPPQSVPPGTPPPRLRPAASAQGGGTGLLVGGAGALLLLRFLLG